VLQCVLQCVAVPPCAQMHTRMHACMSGTYVYERKTARMRDIICVRVCVGEFGSKVGHLHSVSMLTSGQSRQVAGPRQSLYVPTWPLNLPAEQASHRPPGSIDRSLNVEECTYSLHTY